MHIKNYRKLGLCILTAITLSTSISSFAQDTEDKAASKVVKKSNAHWFGWLSGSYNNDWAEDYRDTKYAELDGDLGYKFNKTFSLSARTGGYYRIGSNESTECSDHNADEYCMLSTYIYAKFHNIYQLGDNTNVSFTSRVMLPTTDNSKDTHLYFGLGLYLPISYNASEYVNGLSLSLTPSITKYFNKYSRIGGSYLVEYRPSIELDVQYQLAAKWFLVFELVNTHYIRYDGTHKNPAIAHGEEIDYLVTNNFYLGLSYSNSSHYYNPEKGSDPVNDLFDDKDPNYSLAATYTF